MQVAPQACALRLSSAGHRARPLGHVGERATQRLEAESALVLVSRSCRGGARALPRPSELLAAGAHDSRESGLWLALRLRIRKTRPITRRGFMVEGGSTGRRLAASRRASSYLFLESAAGADERARLGREPQPHEIHIARRAWSAAMSGAGREALELGPAASDACPSMLREVVGEPKGERAHCTRPGRLLFLFIFFAFSF